MLSIYAKRKSQSKPAETSGVRFVRLPDDIILAVESTEEFGRGAPFAAIVQKRLRRWFVLHRSFSAQKYLPDEYAKRVKYLNLDQDTTTQIQAIAKDKGWNRCEVIKYLMRRVFAKELTAVETAIRLGRSVSVPKR